MSQHCGIGGPNGLTAEHDRLDGATASRRTLFVFPHERREGFWANIRGHALDLADPGSGDAVAPTPDDLFALALASELAWSARDLLREHDLPEDVSVSAQWLTYGPPPSPAELHFTLTVSRRAASVRARLANALETRLATRSLVETGLQVSFEGATR